MRLVNEVDVNGYATGALQVFCDGAWGAVCTSNFEDVDALVACRQLGFTTGTVLRDLTSFGREPVPAVCPSATSLLNTPAGNAGTTRACCGVAFTAALY